MIREHLYTRMVDRKRKIKWLHLVQMTASAGQERGSVLNYSALQLEDNSNDPTDSGMNVLCTRKGAIKGYFQLL